MKKKDILRLVKDNIAIENNKDIVKNAESGRYRLQESNWYPNIPELNEYFEILKKELKESVDSYDAAIKDKKKNSSMCDHQVRSEYYWTFGSTCECVLCGNKVSSDNCINFFESDSRNKHTVTFIAKYQTDDYYDDVIEVEKGTSNNDIYNYILRILSEYKDEDEVDLVSEFSKLNIPNMTINTEKRKQEKYILIIAGTNKEYLNDSTYITNKYDLKVEDYYNKFISMLNTKVAIIDNGFSYDDFSSKVKVINYDTLDSLNKAISELKDANFSVVIDLTNLYKYKIVDDELISEEYRLPLGELFPNSEIITTSEKENVDDKCNEIKKLIKNR